ncbi:hypothetical protein AOQ84DRAFT_321782 [Glonium stellatum]|uniref:DASH complex subunit DUO1 n=1 Tax=Glonium stellatum TaxID=574774 RepID=A0A8E2JQS8_9PEZI|nr:hypothetical protein AOQ84DRAFT_321782 [Glonium stellatum]
MDNANIDDLTLSDSDPDALFDSPATRKTKSKDASANITSPEDSAPPKTRPAESRYSTEEARDAALRKELDSVRNVNKVIEDVVESLQKARSNMDTVSRTVHNASTLLQTWTRILSQTEHNQRLILNRSWQGATQDLADLENEAIQRQYAAERREMEEQARKEAAARKAEAEEKRRQEAAAKPGTKGRGRGRGTRAGSVTASSSGYVGVGGQGGRGAARGGSTTGTRGGSGIGRGLRGRGRGLG